MEKNGNINMVKGEIMKTITLNIRVPEKEELGLDEDTLCLLAKRHGWSGEGLPCAHMAKFIEQNIIRTTLLGVVEEKINADKQTKILGLSNLYN